MENKLSTRQMKILRQRQDREDKEAQREWLHQELQAKHGEVRQ